MKSLLRNLKWAKHEFKILDDRQQKLVVAHLQNEQITMLEILFALAQDQDCDAGKLVYQTSHLKKFMKYLIKTDFRGYMVYGLDQETSRQVL